MYWNEAAPLKFAFGVNVYVPSAFTTTVPPTALSATAAKVKVLPSASVPVKVPVA